MKVLGINGSPRKGAIRTRFSRWRSSLSRPLASGPRSSRSAEAISALVWPAWPVSEQNGRCIIEDDMLNEVVAKFGSIGGIVLGSPTYFADVSSDMKAFMDRAGMVANANGAPLSTRRRRPSPRSAAAGPSTASTP